MKTYIARWIGLVFIVAILLPTVAFADIASDITESGGQPLFGNKERRANLLTGHTAMLLTQAESDAPPIYTCVSNKPKVATVDELGLLTGKAPGKATIRIKDARGRVVKSFLLVVRKNEYYISPNAFAKVARSVFGKPKPGEGMTNLSGKIWLNDGHVMVNLYFYNCDSRTQPPFTMPMHLYFSLNPDVEMENFWYVTTAEIACTRQIKPGKVATVQVDLGPCEQLCGLMPSQVDLTGAMALAQEAAKGMGINANRRQLLAKLLH